MQCGHPTAGRYGNVGRVMDTSDDRAQPHSPTGSSVVAAILLDAVPEWDRIAELLAPGHQDADGFRHRVIDVPLGLDSRQGAGHSEVAHRWHLERATLPAPASFDHALAAARAESSTPDPLRSRWDLTLLDGLDGGKAALLVRAHRPAADDSESGGSVLSWARTTSEQAAETVRAATHLMTSTAMAVARALLGHTDSSGVADTTARSVPRLHVVETPLAEFRRACATAECRVESGFAAATTIAYAEYRRRVGRSGREIRATLCASREYPTISSLVEAAPTPNSTIDLMQRIDRRLPADAYDPTWRCPGVALPPGADRFGPQDVVFDRLPGSSTPLYVGGAKVERYYGFAPAGGAAVTASLLTYRDSGCLGVTVDPEIVPDRDTFDACLRWGVRAVVGG